MQWRNTPRIKRSFVREVYFALKRRGLCKNYRSFAHGYSYMVWKSATILGMILHFSYLLSICITFFIPMLKIGSSLCMRFLHVFFERYCTIYIHFPKTVASFTLTFLPYRAALFLLPDVTAFFTCILPKWMYILLSILPLSKSSGCIPEKAHAIIYLRVGISWLRSDTYQRVVS